ICVDPASPNDPALLVPLAAFTIAASHDQHTPPAGTPTDALVVYPEAFEGACDGSGDDVGLGVRWVRDTEPPVDLGSLFVTGANGSHILDTQLVIADVLLDIGRRASR
ncbi:MAG: hypothetical protein KC656_26670, partial [Myxococcales bacterium]|nr:hypothetical protein [Myxococcales bacterium]